jgi:hypothetical protein
MSRLQVDRERFLALAGALAAASSCYGAPRGVPAELPPSEPASEPSGEVAPKDEAEPAHASPSVIVEPPPSEAASPGPSCDNSIGHADCSQISSTCEGLRGSCQMLADGHPYEPRVAEAVARCWTRRGAQACNMRARQQCYLEGIQQGCSDPRYEAECQQRIDDCNAAGKPLRYTLGECVQALSAISDPGERSWASGAMGPTAEGACKLMFPVY